MICHKNVLEVGSFRGSYKLSRRRNPSPLRKRHFLGNSISRIGVKFRTFSFDRLAAHSNLIELPERRKRFARFTSGVHITIVFRGISATAGDWGCFCIWFRFHSCWGEEDGWGSSNQRTNCCITRWTMAIQKESKVSGETVLASRSSFPLPLLGLLFLMFCELKDWILRMGFMLLLLIITSKLIYIYFFMIVLSIVVWLQMHLIPGLVWDSHSPVVLFAEA